MPQSFQPGEDTIGLWSIRFRFRLGKSLSSEDAQVPVSIADRQGVLQAVGNTALKQSRSVVLSMHGFPDETSARKFAAQLRIALMIAAIETSLGIDLGDDKATSDFSQEIKDALARQGTRLLPDVHGAQVYQREGNERVLSISATGYASHDPDRLSEAVNVAMEEKLEPVPKLAAAIEMIALSMMAREPLAEAALCLAAVEMVALRDPWSTNQHALIERLIEVATAATDLATEEAIEVGEAVKKVHKSIRQGIKGLILDTLGMQPAEWKEFDRVYSLRSTIFHSTKKEMPSRELQKELAERARSICARIVLNAARRQS